MRPCVLVPLLAAGCFSPSYKTHDLRCEVNTHKCPDGFHCAADDRCWKNGTDPLLDMRGAPPVADLSSPPMPDLAPTGLANGVTCKVDGDCASAHCVDGVCCDKACTGQCEACDGNVPGTCAAVQGPPHKARPACNGAGGACGGTCDGNTTTQCTYPATTQICGAACNSHCDGNGTCPGGTGSCPNGFACGAGMCKTSCANNNDCQTNFVCMAPSCVRIAESDCLDGIDNNGDGKIDCDDPTCTDVECVTNPGATTEIGLLASACPASGYTSAEAQHQGLSMPTCTGCACTASLICQQQVGLYLQTGSNCTTGPSYSLTIFDYEVPAPGWCTVNPNGSATVYNFSIGAQSVYQSSCTQTGSPKLPAPQWTKTTSFCATPRRSTNNCHQDASLVCVPKPAGAAKLCVRVPGAASGCPGGYAGSSGVYYSGYTPGSCGQCSDCEVQSASCTGTGPVDLWSDNGCNNLVTSLQNVGPGCYDNGGQTVIAASYNGPGTKSIMCKPPSVTTNYATPSGASVICCQ